MSMSQVMPTTQRAVLFSGKGGVGKTTLAAATAAWFARRGERVLVASTDPAHSLSDVFAVPIGHRETEVAPHLFAREMDAKTRWSEAMEELTGAAGQEKNRKQRGLQEKLAQLAGGMGDTPGVDEFLALELFMEALASSRFDRVILDTAPTGHTLRLLSLPQVMDGWLGRLFVLKDQLDRLRRGISRLWGRKKDEASLGEQVDSTRHLLAGLREGLQDPGQTFFCLVTIPEAMSVQETSRTHHFLAREGIPVAVVIANQIQPVSPGCAHCAQRRQVHEAELLRMRRELPGQAILHLAAQSQPVQGETALFELSKTLWGSPGES